MRDAYCSLINRVAKGHDKDLSATRSHLGMVVINRRATVGAPSQQVFALTDNWTVNGKPREWGAEVVLQRLKQHDMATNIRFMAELDAREERLAEQKQRDLENKNEAWAYENHKMFKDAFKDTLTHGMDMSDRRRRRFEESQKFKKV